MEDEPLPGQNEATWTGLVRSGIAACKKAGLGHPLWLAPSLSMVASWTRAWSPVVEYRSHTPRRVVFALVAYGFDEPVILSAKTLEQAEWKASWPAFPEIQDPKLRQDRQRAGAKIESAWRRAAVSLHRELRAQDRRQLRAASHTTLAPLLAQWRRSTGESRRDLARQFRDSSRRYLAPG